MAETPPTWIDTEFLEKALRADGNHPDVTVTGSEIKRATVAGDHYGSDMYRAALKTKENGNSEDISIIIKCKLRTGELSKIVDTTDIFTKEAETFTDIHVPMHKMLNHAFPDNYHPFAPKCLHVDNEQGALILEDLKKYGFRLATVTQGLDLKHCLLVMRAIAQYHAGSLVLRRKNPNVLKNFEELFYKKYKSGFSGFFTAIAKSLTKAVEKWPGYEKYLPVCRALETKAMDLWVDAAVRDDPGFNVLSHGDLWMNNMMFRYSETNEVQDVRLVDFQLSYLTSPAVDLHYFMNSSASPEVLKNDRQLLINEYYNTMCKTLSALGHQDLQPSKETINSELEKRHIFGTIAGFTVRAFALADRNHVPDVDNIILKNEGNIHLSQSYQEAVKTLLPLYDRMGWLEGLV